MASSLLPNLQKHLRNNPGQRQLVRSPQYDEQTGFGESIARLSSATLLESPMRAIAVGECDVSENQFRYFIDGIQRSWLLYYQDYAPVYYGYVAAAVRQRPKVLMSTWQYRVQEAIYLPYRYFDPTELANLAANFTVVDTAPRSMDELAEDDLDDKQPQLLREAARNAISDRREKLESDLAELWIKQEQPGWLVMDGSITISKAAAEHNRIIGLIKSHNTQYFRFPEQEVILNLKPGDRSSTFTPPGRHPVCSWYLRLRDNRNEDAYFGLVRVEAPLKARAQVDEISRWILTERRPLSLPDSRWDKMIYPIRDCEQFLRSQEPSRATFGWLG
ncbi:hypothetical protein [Pseudanabaena sp. PCC 6802]|uniref:hypothetical protein n=1 Tax=Pseudanabaena sp. PCC 6802 TaxID=118173 RepID=UPI000344AFEB|nr:hypothetical protein [Pseudanabaena sp. PCC 6802]